jgi:hypothetical protein
VLREILGPSEFSVHDRTLRRVQPIPFGQSADWDITPGSPETVTVSVEQSTAELLLRGGERVRMYFDRKQRRLFVPPYDQELVSRKPLIPAGRGPVADLTVGFHSPRREPDREDRVRFRCSLASVSGQPVARPAMTLIRVRGLKHDGTPADDLWYAFDPLFATDASTPVVEFVAENWPADCPRAQVEFWASWQPLPPDETLSLGEILDSPKTFSDTAPARELIARRSPAGDGTVFLIENFRAGGPIENPFWMRLSAGDNVEAPDVFVRHRFDSLRGVHLQEMTPGRAAGAETWQLELRSFQRLSEGSLSIADPVELTILRAGTILQPTGD